jgi:hypothetical protein
LSENTFANAAYSKDKDAKTRPRTKSLFFDLDVSMGNIIFKDAAAR